MVAMRALIDDRQYFNRIEYYYQMFSHDRTYYNEDIEIEPSKISRISTTAISALLQALIQYGQRGEKSFIIATHGNPNGLPIRIRRQNAATLNADVMDALVEAMSSNPTVRTRGRDFAMTYQANGATVFQNQQQLDEILNLSRSVRQLRLEHLEFRGCNIGAGPALRSLHQLLGSRVTAGPTVQFMWTRLSTASYRSIIADQFARQVARLPPERRTFTDVDCYRAGDLGNTGEDVLAIGLSGDTIQLVVRSRDMIKGWSQAYLQNNILFAVGREPAGGGYRPGGYLPFVGFLTPNGRYPFVVPGDSFEYTACLAYEMQLP